STSPIWTPSSSCWVSAGAKSQATKSRSPSLAFHRCEDHSGWCLVRRPCRHPPLGGRALSAVGRPVGGRRSEHGSSAGGGAGRRQPSGEGSRTVLWVAVRPEHLGRGGPPRSGPSR